MTRDMILETLLNEPRIKRYCQTWGKYSDDLYQSTWEVILKMPEAMIIEINEKGYLVFYVLKIAKSIALKEVAKPKHNSLESAYTACYEPENQMFAKMDVKLIRADIEKNMHWYDGRMLETYLLEGSYRKVQKQTTIGYNSVKATVQKVRKYLNGIK